MTGFESAKIADELRHRHVCLREENCCILKLPLLGQYTTLTPTATAAAAGLAFPARSVTFLYPWPRSRRKSTCPPVGTRNKKMKADSIEDGVT